MNIIKKHTETYLKLEDIKVGTRLMITQTKKGDKSKFSIGDHVVVIRANTCSEMNSSCYLACYNTLGFGFTIAAEDNKSKTAQSCYYKFRKT